MNGVIVIDKPSGPTSAEIVRQIKRRLGKSARVGHLGTLDPFATGVLPILVGEGTKLAPFLEKDAKEYTGLIVLGSETDTLDSTGKVARIAPVPTLDTAGLAAIAGKFTGAIEQRPPIFSAIKRDGVPLYKLAHRGLQVDPPQPRTVEIQRLELKKGDNDSIRFEVVCSAGMYVRSLARDIGIALGTAAHLQELRRVRSGSFSIVDARPPGGVFAALERGADPGLVCMRAALAALPEVEIDSVLEQRLRHGDAHAIERLGPRDASLFKVISRGELVAIARCASPAIAVIVRVFAADKPSA